MYIYLYMYILDRAESVLGSLNPKPPAATTESWMNFLARQCGQRWQTSILLGLLDADVGAETMVVEMSNMKITEGASTRVYIVY